MNPKVDFFFNKSGQWQKEYEQLRKTVLSCGLTETLKWGVPCYTFQNSNIVLIHGFKEYCALLFHKGALLQDVDGILIRQTDNVQAARQIRFTGISEIVEREAVLKAYIYEALEVEKSGLKVDFKRTGEYEVPEEFQERLESDPSLKAAFEGLTPGRQRGYLLYFSQPKLAKSRASRVERSIVPILRGEGLNDR